jgi:hypothetical protein
MPRRFSATIYKLGVNPCVDVPAGVSQAFGRRGVIPVTGTLNGSLFRANLMPKGDGTHRLYLNEVMRKAAGADVGDRVDVLLEFDPQPRLPSRSEALTRALEANPRAKAAFERLTPSRRKEILAYLNALKRPESLQRNVEKVIAYLLGRGSWFGRP